MTRLSLSVSVSSAVSGASITALDFAISPVLQYVRADRLLESAGRVSAWYDRAASQLHYTQGTGANQMLYEATSGPSGTPCVRGDSQLRYLESSLNLPAPLTTPTLVYMVIKQVVWNSGWRLTEDGAAGLGHTLYQTPTTPDLRMYSSVAGALSAGAVINRWTRVAAYWDGGATSFIKVGTAAKASASPGSAASTGRRIGSAAFSPDVRYSELLYLTPTSTAEADADIDSLDDYLDQYYGANAVRSRSGFSSGFSSGFGI